MLTQVTSLEDVRQTRVTSDSGDITQGRLSDSGDIRLRWHHSRTFVRLRWHHSPVTWAAVSLQVGWLWQQQKVISCCWGFTVRRRQLSVWGRRRCFLTSSLWKENASENPLPTKPWNRWGCWTADCRCVELRRCRWRRRNDHLQTGGRSHGDGCLMDRWSEWTTVWPQSHVWYTQHRATCCNGDVMCKKNMVPETRSSGSV